jgi:hypothetical protein
MRQLDQPRDSARVVVRAGVRTGGVVVGADDDALPAFRAEMGDDVAVGRAGYLEGLVFHPSAGALELLADIGGGTVQVLRMPLVPGREAGQSPHVGLEPRRIDHSRAGCGSDSGEETQQQERQEENRGQHAWGHDCFPVPAINRRRVR